MTLRMHKEMTSTYPIALQKPLNKAKICHINQVDEVLVTTLILKTEGILVKVTAIKTIIFTKETAQMLVTPKVTMLIKLTVQTKVKMVLTVFVLITIQKYNKRPREVITTHSSLANVA